MQIYSICQQNGEKLISGTVKNLKTTWFLEKGNSFEDTAGQRRPEWVNKKPNSQYYR
jgi:hypothetical protein